MASVQDKKADTSKKEEAKKEPFYKKWWFWVIVVVVLALGMASGGTEENNSTDESASNTSEEQEAEQSTEQTEEKKEEKKEIVYIDNPAEWIKNEVIKTVGEEQYIDSNYVPDTHFSLIKFKGRESWNNKKTIEGMYNDIYRILKAISKDIDVDVDFNVVYSMVDKYGNSSDDIVIKATYKNGTIKKINYDNIAFNTIPSLADGWWDAPGVRLENVK